MKGVDVDDDGIVYQRKWTKGAPSNISSPYPYANIRFFAGKNIL